MASAWAAIFHWNGLAYSIRHVKSTFSLFSQRFDAVDADSAPKTPNEAQHREVGIDLMASRIAGLTGR